MCNLLSDVKLMKWFFCHVSRFVIKELMREGGELGRERGREGGRKEGGQAGKHKLSCKCVSDPGPSVLFCFFSSPPFSGIDQMMTYNLILKGIEKMDFPRKITRRPEDLIRRLCRWEWQKPLGPGESEKAFDFCFHTF